MSESKHTPGPWKTQTHISLDRLEIRDADGRRIAECAMDFPMSAKTHDANAHLMAAAPETLRALEDCCLHACNRDGYCFNGHSTVVGGKCNIVKSEGCHIWDAIQKARGEAANGQ